MITVLRSATFAGAIACILVLGCSSEAPVDGSTGTEPTEKAAKPQEGIEFLKDGASAYQLVLHPGASPSEKHAAEEIQTHVKACAGVELPIVEGKPANGAPMIVLGCGDISKELGVNPSAEELGEQGFLLQTVEPHIVIAGTAAVGTLYGARDFVKSELGVRWYAPGITKTPALKDVVVIEQKRLVKPAFAWRNTSYACPGGDAEFRARRGENNGGNLADNPLGVQHVHDGRCHSYFRYISPGEFFATHPEYFSEIGGKRIEKDTQLCLTNPEVLDIVTERIMKRMADRPNDRQHNFSQMDYYNYCECAKCTIINDKYETLGGTQYWFLNQLAERTAKVYPNKLVGTLAYMYTEEPPKDMTMHPNVAVWLCHMYPSCDSHPIATCELNADYKRRATKWSEICSHLYMWHYIVDFAHYFNPFPNFRAMAADMKFYKEIGVEGIYAQAMGHGGGGGEFSLLRPYYATELLWNPDQDADAILRDFLDGYYGAAAEPIWQYITLLHDKVDKDNVHMHLYTNPAQGYLPDEIVAKGEALFDEAEKAVEGDEEMVERVRVARMPLVYARMFPRNGYAFEDGSLIFKGDITKPDEMQQFIDRADKHGFKHIREWGGNVSQVALYSAIFNTALPVKTISNEFLTVDIVPTLGGRAMRITDRKTSKCVTAYNVMRNLMFPFGGGETNHVGGVVTASLGGAMDPAVAKATSDTSVTLEQTAAGFKLQRTIALAPDKPTVHIEAVLTNTSDKPRHAQLRSHLDLDMGTLETTRVKFTSRDGKEVDKDMTDIIAGMREGEHYYDQDCPAGTWTFSGSKGLDVTQRFSDEAMDYAWLYAYPDYLQDLEVELWLHPKTLEPGKSITLTQELEVHPAS